MQLHYLTGERLYLRPMRLEDKDHSLAWHDSPVPISAVQAEKHLREASTADWEPSTIHLAIVRRSDEQLVGRVSLTSSTRRWGTVRFKFAPWLDQADQFQADVLRLVVPWLRDEHEWMTVVAQFAADQAATVAAAEELGMEQVVRLREHLARPGGRIDELHYQAIGRPWEVRDA